ncbi:uncharacterized protein DS421_8g247370 [Arachis hypogaea]|nr:uncharacterized protein DS421_8g247370 [Arachis hypogaea]
MTVQASPSTPTTLSTPVTSQVGLADQQFIMVPNLNYVPPSATPLVDPMTTDPAVSDSFSTSQQDVTPPLPVIRMRIWPDGIRAKIYDYQTAKRFQQRISDVRKGRDHLWSWIRLSIKKKLETYFTLDEGFKYRHLTNVANRAFPKSSKHTGGSTTFIKTKSILSKSLDREATLAETIKYTHTLKANKEKFADE